MLFVRRGGEMPGRDELSRAGQALRTQSGAAVVVGNKVSEDSQGGVYRARAGDTWLAVRWIRPGTGSDTIRQWITDLIRRGRPPHPGFMWPLDLVSSDQVPGFGYIMPLLEPRFTPLISVLGDPRPPSFRVTAAIGRELADAFEALHACGLCYRDALPGNFLVDRDTGELAIIGVDNFGLDGEQAQVVGSWLYSAPELLRGEVFPSAVTDLHSLAVILFYLLMHGHPLLGRRTDAYYDSEASTYMPEDELLMGSVGLRPLFIFDPDDRSNRPRPEDIVSAWWPVYPQAVRGLFTRAFTSGLRDASLKGRVPEGAWRRALLRLHDSASTCANCGASVCYDLEQPGQRCWHCDKILPSPATLEVPGGILVLSEGAIVNSHHLHQDRHYRSACATVEQHPGQSDCAMLRNLTDRTWTVVPDGEEPGQVGPGLCLPVRPMQVDFGGVEGRILYPDSAAS
jgi:eukaryotic-like serine/threonine-protein kinase